MGIDLCKDRLDVGFWPSEKTFGEPNDDKGIARLVKRLSQRKASVVVLESTGRPAVPVALQLGEAGVPYRIVNPRQVRDFAKALGQLAKTDRIDSLVLARWAESARLAPKPLPDAEHRELRALVMRRLQLIESWVAEKNRLRGEVVPKVRKSLLAGINWLKRQIDQLEADLDRAIKDSPILLRRKSMVTINARDRPKHREQDPGLSS